MYQVGKLYRWVGQVGAMACMNGTECAVTGPVKRYRDPEGRWRNGWPTDAYHPVYGTPRHTLMAWAGDLVPVDPPSGERSVIELFKLPELEHA